jgi:hypothetical protein
VEALAIHGRDWKAAAAHVGTRDAKAFTSHAQKYFIKMCINGQPLPPKLLVLMPLPKGPCRGAAEMNRIRLVLFDMNNRMFLPYLAAMHRTLVAFSRALREACTAYTLSRDT